MTSITVFTSNQSRHLSLIKDLAEISDKCFVIQECSSLFPGSTESFYRKSNVMKLYFDSVLKAESKLNSPY